MSTVQVTTAKGTKKGSVDLPDEIFGIEPNVAVMHQVVTAQLAAKRAGTHSTKTRAEVSGGGSKPWRQKGTGRARQGSTRAPHWRGGGTVFGPQPRDYRTEIPRKVKQLARKSALNARAREGALHVVERFAFRRPKTAQPSVYRAKIILSRLAGVGVRARAYGRGTRGFSPCRDRSMGR